jgi:SAM-dependent methyltransferase
MDADMKINPRGYWENSTAEGHGHDAKLAEALLAFFEKERTEDLYDIGCGDGFYTKYILENSRIRIRGLDGNPNTTLLAGPFSEVCDLSKPISFPARDWVLSLEVGEHIPAEFEQIFLNNLHKLNKCGIVLSWAIRGQGGDGHVNCLENEEVIERIQPLGYKLDPYASIDLRNKCAEYPETGWWFRNTLMIFRKLPSFVPDGKCSLGYDFKEGGDG